MERVVLIDCDSLRYKNIEDLDEYKDRIDTIISDIVSLVDADYYKCFLEVKGNITFRKAEFNDYKANRKRPKLHNMDEIRDYIVDTYDAHLSIGVETDDSIISTWKYLRDEYPLTEVFIAASDKDYLTYPVNYIDIYYGRYLDVTSVSQEDADYNFVFQMLMGDSVDNVKCLKGIGEKSAEKLLKNVNNHWVSYAKLLIPLYKRQFKSSRLAKNTIVDNYKKLRLKDNLRPCTEFTEVIYEEEEI
jgi:5'-3' exonuclease